MPAEGRLKARGARQKPRSTNISWGPSLSYPKPHRQLRGNSDRSRLWQRDGLALAVESIMLRRRMSIWSRISQAISAIGDSVATFLAKITQPRSNPEMSIAFTIGVIAL